MSLEEFDEVKYDHSTKRLDTPSRYLLRKARRNPNGLQELRESMKIIHNLCRKSFLLYIRRTNLRIIQ